MAAQKDTKVPTYGFEQLRTTWAGLAKEIDRAEKRRERSQGILNWRKLEDEERYSAARKRHQTPVRVMALGCQGVGKTTIGARLFGLEGAIRHTAGIVRKRLDDVPLEWIDTFGSNLSGASPADHESVLRDLAEVEVVLLFLRWPRTREQDALLDLYRQRRKKELFARDLVVVSGNSTNADPAGIQASLITSGLSDPKVYTVDGRGIDEQLQQLGHRLDQVLAGYCNLPVPRPGLPLEAGGLLFKGLADLDEQDRATLRSKHNELTVEWKETKNETAKLVRRSQEISDSLAKLNSDVQDARAGEQSTLIQKKQLIGIKGRIRAETTDGPPPNTVAGMKQQTASVVESNYPAFETAIRLASFGVSSDDMDLLLPEDQLKFATRVTAAMIEAGNASVDQWVMGQTGPDKQGQNTTGSTSLSLQLSKAVSENCTWLANQLATLRLPQKSAVPSPDAVKNQVQKLLSRHITIDVSRLARQSRKRVAYSTALGASAGAGSSAVTTAALMTIKKIALLLAGMDPTFVTAGVVGVVMGGGTLGGLYLNKRAKHRERENNAGLISSELRDAMTAELKDGLVELRNKAEASAQVAFDWFAAAAEKVCDLQLAAVDQSLELLKAKQGTYEDQARSLRSEEQDIQESLRKLRGKEEEQKNKIASLSGVLNEVKKSVPPPK